MANEIKSAEPCNHDMTVQEIVGELTLFDDDLMSRVFDNNIPATELLIRIVLGRKLKIISAVGQYEMKNPNVDGRNITLDVLAEDENGKLIDIEVQGNPNGSHVKRARFHSSSLDVRMLKESQEFKKLADSYMIFMYRHDKFGKGFPLYHVERFITETMQPFDDGSHIIYVNGNYKGDDEYGRLVADFKEKNPDNIFYKELSDGVRHFKENEEGKEVMCDLVEKYAEKYAERATEVATEKATKATRIDNIRKLMQNMKLTLDEALNALGITGEEREEIASQIGKMD